LDRSLAESPKNSATQTALHAAFAQEGSILELLEQHGSLAYEQIAAHIHEAPDSVRNALARLRDRGLVDVLSVGELEGHSTRAAAYWRLSDAGRSELARRHST
jgi:predicted ArsR family transcriptional regulator